MAPSTKKRAQGGGRTANSEPRQQVFRDFNGCNFEVSPRDFTLGKEVDQEQSDLQMNYVVIQDNAGIATNKTIETRNNLVPLLEAPSDKTFSGPAILVNDEIYLAMSDKNVWYESLNNIDNEPVTMASTVTLNNNTSQETVWKDFEYVDNKLVGMTAANQLWTGDLGSHVLENAKAVTNPTTSSFSISGQGDLSDKVGTYDATNRPYRFGVAIAYINKYGPTLHSGHVTKYAYKPVLEWHTGRYVRVSGTAPANQGIEAIEIYYTAGDANNLQLAGRVDRPEDLSDNQQWSWIFNWYGYLDATSMWPVSQLIAPEENVTEGPKATHVKCIDSRLYFWGNSSKPYRLFIGGNPGNLFNTAPGTGGGFVDVEPGSGEEIRFVGKYKTQSGASIVTMLCDSKNSMMEQRFNLVENSISLSNEQTMKSWQAEQVAGSVGVKGFDGAIVCEDGLYSVSRYGLALTTMTMEYNSQIRTNYVSDPIKPVFTDKTGTLLKNAHILECDGIIYVAFGSGDDEIDNLLFCYDIDKKAWWTISLDIGENNDEILNLIHIDYEGFREGIGIITKNTVYLLPLTQNDPPTKEADFNVTIQTGELSTTIPQQNWFYLNQMEFRFDYFIGSVLVELTGIDQFGRKVSTRKTFSHDETVYNLAEYMRVDLRLQSYQIRITGQARFRLTHFISKVYTMSSKQGLVWGFDDSQTFRSAGDIHPTFKDYNDIRKAIIP